jgi:hypothetical protein
MILARDEMRCYNCGTENAHESTQCYVCHTAIDPKSAAGRVYKPPPKQSKGNKKMMIIVFVIVGIVVLAIVGTVAVSVLVFWASSSSSTSSSTALQLDVKDAAFTKSGVFNAQDKIISVSLTGGGPLDLSPLTFYLIKSTSSVKYTLDIDTLDGKAFSTSGNHMLTLGGILLLKVNADSDGKFSSGDSVGLSIMKDKTIVWSYNAPITIQ